MIALSAISSLSSAQDNYRVKVDLTMAKYDRLPVEVFVPKIKTDEAEYHMAKIVPGTYSISDFGRFVVDFKAMDAEGAELQVEKKSTNRWVIKDATRLNCITYWIEDSFDDFDLYGENKLFEPGGMGIDAENQVFVMNTFGFIGYIDELKFQPYELTIKHKAGLYGATSLQRVQSGITLDIFTAENFNFLADAPIMYCEPDTVSKHIAGANVMISVYSANKKLSALDVMNNVDELMEAQAKYLGGELPVDRYVYLIYLFDNPTISGAYGALEHSYSSLYVLPEMNLQQISQTIRDVAAHEFFHIVTPLNLHSEEIHYFNYIEPEMSQHLWLYEGVTEYASHHVQAKYGLYDVATFLSEMKSKMVNQERYNVDIPYTEFSENILKPENKDRYGDVYNGGALIAMCLDLTIIKSTAGKKDLQSILREMSKKYGPFKAFQDENLFDEIEKLTNKEVGDFLRTYVGGAQPLPYKKVLGWAGIDYGEIEKMIATTGKFGLAITDTDPQEIYINDISNINEFGKALDYREGDILVSWNGQKVTLENINQVFEDYYYNTELNTKVKVVVKREVKGKMKKVKLKAMAVLVKSTDRHVLTVNENPSEEQLKIRKSWLSTK